MAWTTVSNWTTLPPTGWTLSGTNIYSGTSTILTQDSITPGGTTVGYYTFNPSFVNATGWTVEFSLQIDPATPTHSAVSGSNILIFQMSDNKHYFNLQFWNGSYKLEQEGTVRTFTNTDKRHTYRFTCVNNTVNFYIDNVFQFTYTATPTTHTSTIYCYRDADSTSNHNSKSYSRYFAYDNTGAFSPDQQPSPINDLIASCGFLHNWL